MEYYSRSWSLNRKQMQKGHFIGSLLVANTPLIQMTYAPYSHGVFVEGDFTKGSVLITCAITKSDVTFQNQPVAKNEIKILKSGDEIDFLPTQQSDTYSILVEEDFFYTQYEAYFGVDFHLHKKDKKIYIKPNLLEYFIDGITTHLNYLLQNNLFKSGNSYNFIENELLTHIFSCIYLDDQVKKRQKFDVNKIRDILHESVEGNCTISDIAKDLKISERLLFNAFKKNYGISPKNYFNSLRFNKIRDVFLKAPEDTNIIEIINKYNFYNQSAFTQSYKRLFEELPSFTIRKKP